MKTKLLLAIALIAGFFTYAQDVKGYVIDAAGQRTDGYFEDSNIANADNVRFRAGVKGGYEKLNLASVHEYGTELSKYVKETVEIDETGGSTAPVSGNREPSLAKKTVFLEVLVEGNASLYEYNDKENLHFFYSIASRGRGITTLIFRRYQYTGTTIAQNVYFRQKLTIDMLCENENDLKFAKTGYTRASLMSAVQGFNICSGNENTFVKKYETLTKIHLGFYGGSTLNKYAVDLTNADDITDSNTGYYAGIEASLNFKYKPYSIFIRIGLERFSASGDLVYKPVPSSVNVLHDKFEAKCTGLNFAIGPRYTFKLNEKNALFAEVSANILKPFDSGKFKYASTGITTAETSLITSLQSPFYFNIGVGYAFSDFSVMASYLTNRNLLGNAPGYKFDVSSVGLMAKYNFL